MKSAAYFWVGLFWQFSGAAFLAAQQEEVVLDRHFFSQPHLGTVVQIALYAKSEESAQVLAEQCFERVKKLNKTFSDYLSESEVSQLCAKPPEVAYPVSEELFVVISKAQEVSKASRGAFDITLGNTTREWRESKRVPKAPSEVHGKEASFRDVILDAESRTVMLRKPLQLDLGGIAKGYIADELMAILKQAGIRQAAVIIGGEMVFAEAPPGKDGWRVGVEKPSHEPLGILSLSKIALSTSGDSYQFFEQDGVRHAHLIDPASGKSKSNRLNVTTLAESAMLADAWATALRVTPLQRARDLAQKTKGLEVAFIPHGEPATFTAGFPQLERP